MSDLVAVQHPETPFGVHVHALYTPMYIAMYNEMYMGMYAVLYVYTSGHSDRSQNGFKPLENIGLNAYEGGKRSKNRNLAKQGHNLAILVPNLAVTSPSKNQFALALFNKARIARLEGSYAYIRARDVHHVCVMYVYKKRIQSNTKLTSSNLVTSPTGFWGCVQHLSPIFRSAAIRTTLPRRSSLASILRGVRTLNATRQSRISCVLTHLESLAVWVIKLAVFVGPPPRERLPLDPWRSRVIRLSLFRRSIIQGVKNDE